MQEDALVEILITLEDAARDAANAAMGVGWKSDIPAVRTIQEAFEKTTDN
jgi:hypothetical protein